MPRRRIGTEEREKLRGLVARWEGSGEPAATFARRHGLTRAKFSYWRGQLAAGRKPRRRESEAVSFAPVQLVRDELAPGTTPSLEIKLSGGDVLRIGSEVSADRLREVVAVLRDRC
jgi:hypothetical protein